jgi:cell wall assembly regulator SMI1
MKGPRSEQRRLSGLLLRGRQRVNLFEFQLRVRKSASASALGSEPLSQCRVENVPSVSFSELLTEFQRISPPLTEHWAPPALKVEIARLQTWLGVPLPPEALEVYRLHNGQADFRVRMVFNHFLSDINQALDDLGRHRDIRDSGVVEDGPPEDRRLLEGFPSAFHVPLLTDDTGNFVGYDLRPGPDGHFGQVVVFGADVDAQVVCGSLGELWGALVCELREGNWELSDELGTGFQGLRFKTESSEIVRLLSL